MNDKGICRTATATPGSAKYRVIFEEAGLKWNKYLYQLTHLPKN